LLRATASGMETILFHIFSVLLVSWMVIIRGQQDLEKTIRPWNVKRSSIIRTIY